LQQKIKKKEGGEFAHSLNLNIPAFLILALKKYELLRWNQRLEIKRLKKNLEIFKTRNFNILFKNLHFFKKKKIARFKRKCWNKNSVRANLKKYCFFFRSEPAIRFFLHFFLFFSKTKNIIKKARLRGIVKNTGNKPASALISTLNPVIQSWCNYHRCCTNSRRVWSKTNQYLYRLLWKWVCNRHNRQSHRLIYDKLLFFFR
jgi:Group II intron, maturase-specific domain